MRAPIGVLRPIVSLGIIFSILSGAGCQEQSSINAASRALQGSHRSLQQQAADPSQYDVLTVAAGSSTNVSATAGGAPAAALDPAADPELAAALNDAARIAHGQPSAAGQFPFMASIAFYNVHGCGGTLVAPRVVLTAAHCIWDTSQQPPKFRDLDSIKVSVGRQERKAYEYRVERVVVPAAFDPAKDYYADIALLALDKPAAKAVKLQLASRRNAAAVAAQSRLAAAGWGFTSASSLLAETLQWTWLNTVRASSCAAQSLAAGLGEVPADHFCAGWNTAPGDTCRGDSGGPVLIPGASVGGVPGVKGDWLVGVTSYGPPKSGCGGSVNVGMYTNVSYWSGWIQDSMSLYNMRGLDPPTFPNTPEFNTCYEGATLKTLRAASAGKCCDGCRGFRDCAGWTWVKASRRCQYKGRGYKAKANGRCHSGHF